MAERIQAVRLRHDAKTAHITAPHVTLAGTCWRSGPATPDNECDTIARLQAVQGQLQPFELALGGAESFLPFNNVIYLRVERTAGLSAARTVLLDALGPDRERRYTPHLTLTTLAPAVQCGVRLDRSETQALLKETVQELKHGTESTITATHFALWPDAALRHRQRRAPLWLFFAGQRR